MLKNTLVVLLVLLVISPLAVAQEPLSETFTSPDGGLTLQYPTNWSVEIDENNVIILSLRRARRLRSTIQIFLPPLIDQIGFGEETDPALLVEQVGMALASTDGGEMNQVDIGDKKGATYAYVNNNNENALLVSLPFDDQLAMLSVTTVDDNLEEMGELVLEIAMTFAQPPAAVQTIQNYDATWQEAVAELEELGLIATGGELIFQENRAFFCGQGNWFTALAERAPRTDVVLAGTLAFQPGSTSELETCTLLSRIATDNEGNATRFLDIGIDNEGGAFYLDRDEETSSDFTSLSNFGDADSHRFLIIALDDQLSVFIDGQSVFEAASISKRAGTYGVALRGRGPEALCEATNIWAYEAPTFQPGVCEISAGGTVNKRNGPGTTFEVAGQLAANVVRTAQGQATGADGFIWWQLDDDSWVRNDVVRASGDCRTVPEVSG